MVSIVRSRFRMACSRGSAETRHARPGYGTWRLVKLAAAVAVASLFAGAFPASAEVMAITCVETVAGGWNSNPVTKSIRIDTSKPEATVRQRGDRAIEHYSNTIEKEKINAADPEVAKALMGVTPDTEKSVSVAGSAVVWTSTFGFTSFRAEYDRVTHRLVETSSVLPHESYIRLPSRPRPPHEYACR
jgi:hypothetical protein